MRVILVAKSEEHLVLGRPRFRWEDNTYMNLKNSFMGCDPDSSAS